MKRLAILVFLLILMPLVSAVINIEGPGKDVYNLGDKIEVKGYILRDEDMFGVFRISLDCESDVPVLTKSVSLKKDTKKSFSESFIIPFYLPGDCSLKISLESAGSVVEQAKSNKFIISKELEGNFKLGDKLIQLGKDISLKGNVYRLDGSDIDGNAVLYFKRNGTLSIVGSSEVRDGKFSFSMSSVAYPAGDYNIEVEIIDTYGNQHMFTDVESFTLVSEIYVFAKPNKISVLPGTVVTIFGEAKTILQEKIDEARVTLIVGDVKDETELKKSKFEYELVLEKDIKSGRHDIEVIVEDALGNIGRTSTNFNVKAIPTSLYADLEVKTYIPGTKIKFKPVLLDQGGDFIIEDISVELINTKDSVEFSKVVKTNELVEYKFEQYAIPGTWIIKSYATGLVHEDQIYVGETLAVDYKLEGQILTITNIGNIVYKRPVEIKLQGEETYTVVKKQRISPGESYNIDLGENVKSGTYEVQVGDKKFSDIVVVGFIKRDYSWLYWILSAITLLLIILLFFRSVRKRRRKRKEKVEEEKNLPEKVKEFLSKKGLTIKKKEEKKEESKKDRLERYKQEFKERILRDIAKRGKKIKPVSKVLPKETGGYFEVKPPEEKKSLMDIFTMKDKKIGGEEQ